jgi:hypothetical protein
VADEERIDKPFTHIAVDQVSKIYQLKNDVVESIRKVSFDLTRGGFMSVVGQRSSRLFPRRASVRPGPASLAAARARGAPV